MSDEHTICGRCGLLTLSDHTDNAECIKGLRDALIEQRDASRRMSFDMSMRYLAAIEELALRPGDAGVTFKVRDPEGNIQIVRAEQVAGIFSAIARRFHSLGDWTPLRDAETRSELMSWHASALLEVLEDLLAGGIKSERAEAVTKSAREDGVRPRGRDRS